MSFTYSFIDITLGAFGGLAFLFLLVAPSAGVREEVLFEIERTATCSLKVKADEDANLTIYATIGDDAAPAVLGNKTEIPISTLANAAFTEIQDLGARSLAFRVPKKPVFDGEFLVEVELSVGGGDGDWISKIVWNVECDKKFEIVNAVVEVGPPSSRETLDEPIIADPNALIQIAVSCPLVPNSSGNQVVFLENVSQFRKGN